MEISWVRSVCITLFVFSLTFSFVSPFFLFGFGQREDPPPGPVSEYGECSWYGPGPGKPPHRMANGQFLRPEMLTAAHRTLPLGSMVLVTNTDNGRTVQVKITDRGPSVYGRISALTPSAFSTVADLDQQVFPCTVTPK